MIDIKTKRLHRTNTWIDYHSFEVKDDKGREVGTKVITYMVEFVEDKDPMYGFYKVPPGNYFCLRVQACRGGKDFGAFQQEKRFKTVAERDAAIAKYLREARNRALKQWGK
jgi:hypothetical protein